MHMPSLVVRPPDLMASVHGQRWTTSVTDAVHRGTVGGMTRSTVRDSKCDCVNAWFNHIG
jgi:hypothetical protein